MKTLITGIAASLLLVIAQASLAGDKEIGVGTATVLQLQISGESGVQNNDIGFVLPGVEDDALILVGSASVTQVQTEGRHNIQNSRIGTISNQD